MCNKGTSSVVGIYSRLCIPTVYDVSHVGIIHYSFYFHRRDLHLFWKIEIKKNGILKFFQIFL